MSLAHSGALAKPAASQEAEIYQLISRSATKGGQKRAAIAAIASHLLRLPGVTGLSLHLIDPAIDCERFYGEIGNPLAIAVGELHYGGQTFGSLRIVFDRHAIELSSPVKAARFAAQQIASVLVHAEKASTYRQLRKQRDTLAQRLETRKVFSRAMAILQSQHGLSEEQAKLFLFAATKRLRKPLLYASRTIITLNSTRSSSIRTQTYRREEGQSHARRSFIA